MNLHEVPVYRDSVLQPDENGKSVQTDLRQSLKPGKSEERKDSRQKPYPGGVSGCHGEEWLM